MKTETAARASNRAPREIEQTSKTYKGAQLIAFLMIVVGVIGMIAGGSSGDASPGWVILFILGLITWISARFGAWWNNG